MKQERFIRLLEGAKQELNDYPYFRYGQALVNVLYRMDVEAANKFTDNSAKDTDCYFDDDKVPAFLEAIYHYWSE